MHHDNLHLWQHAHSFGQEHKRSGEHRTTLVIAITATMMAVEIVTGIVFGSMALLADGLHMASHTTALFINVFAYIYARRHAHDARYSFGTGKVNALGEFTGAILLAVFALMMAWGSIERLIHPVSIAFNQAIFVAIIGLVVNGASVFILAIIALLAAKYFGLIWMDPLMGIVGAILVCQWSLGLLRVTSSILLDRQGSEELKTKIKGSIESASDNRVADLHLWAIGPNIYGVIILVVTHNPEPHAFYKKLLPPDLGFVHVTVEVHQCPDREDSKL